MALASRMGGEGKVVAIDLAEGMLDYSARKARAFKLRNIEFKKMNAQQLEFEDNTFDVVACSLKIFYFPDIEGALQEMLRVLKPGGVLGISTADARTAFAPLSEPYMERLYKTADELDVHPPEYSELSVATRKKEGLQRLIEEAGFTNVEMHQEEIPVHFSSPEDWWSYGRGSTWGDLLLDQLPDDERRHFKQEHLGEVKPLFTKDGIRTATPIVFALARKP
jgi:ubiquinone/menaquinone biosynthesis C-methylase UbiE